MQSGAFAQVQIDTLEAELDDIVVTGYQTNRSILETPGSVTFIPSQTLSSFDQSSLVYGLNTVPGVRMEERAPGSYRVSIRGSSLRSPFGIRNVKIYWNGIPLTEPTGSTFLNLLDPFNMQEVEVIKGPGGSVYGAGNGGVLLIESTAPFNKDHLTMNSSVGSFGAWNYDLGYSDKFEGGNLNFKYSDGHTDGYRDQSFMDRRVAEISGNFRYAEGREVTAGVLYSDLNYGIPGGLNSEQFQTDPTQARPGNPFVQGSVESNASIKQEQMLLMATHHYQITDRLSNESSAFGVFSDFENPFNLDYKVDNRMSGGFRTIYEFDFELGSVPGSITAGSEYQASSYASRNYGNIGGETDTLNFDDELKVRTTLVYSNVEFDLANDWYISAGLSFNRLKYNINRLYAASGYGSEGQVIKDFNDQFIPRIGIAKKITPTITGHVSMGLGFSPPTIEEVRTNEGSINRGLQAEKGTNFELGFRGNALEGRFGFDAVAFLFKLDESIVQRESDRGTVLFRNAGSTDQKGFELNLNYLIYESYLGFIEKVQLHSAYTYHHFEFNDYVTADGDYSGNALTGVPPHSLVSTLKVTTAPGVYANFTHNFTDDIPLNDENSVYSDPYQLVQGRIGIRSMLFDRLEFDLYFGMDNLLDERYSLGYDINAFGNRYYQPAPERNWFAGLKLDYNL